MSCKIHNNVGGDFGDLEGHIQDMYGFFSNKYSFDKHPAIHLDSDEQNKAEILGKTAYYDPQTHEVHIYTDGRHPKDMLRSIAHELIHHKQNLEDRLQVGGYNGPGDYLKNDKLKDIEHEAMLEGNACMREWEDTKKHTNPKESKDMSLKEWKNNELNGLLLKKFGILKESKDQLEENDCNKCEDDCKCEEEIEEGRMNPRTTNKDKFAGHEDRDQADRIHEGEEGDDAKEEENTLQEAIRRIAKAKKVFLKGKRIK